ncbi:BolA family transcriptional regulator [Aliidiomarina minuta]|uniref:BolA family transcriptional regulator n=1 Tax=Aliidiomarina minuta TaxID=880057 RepID=A0A432W533_9GAMM|nr:BolA/IbaG family iron-sulfur metabolism protein [Aliidiomarina minuta]RUO25170.1 BolA family transcriptional regulator [Aliidiomarina minuta]
MSVEQRIESLLRQNLTPDYLEVVNESHMHGGSATESHFKVIVVSTHFSGQRLLARHRQINKLLADELAGPVHALAMHTYTPEEWQEEQQAPDSPACLGGSK